MSGIVLASSVDAAIYVPTGRVPRTGSCSSVRCSSRSSSCSRSSSW
ncbi:hypothetical protein NKG05_15435 [Oerskovia sp. M15]